MITKQTWGTGCIILGAICVVLGIFILNEIAIELTRLLLTLTFMLAFGWVLLGVMSHPPRNKGE
jgi:hypothetical protein